MTTIYRFFKSEVNPNVPIIVAIKSDGVRDYVGYGEIRSIDLPGRVGTVVVYPIMRLKPDGKVYEHSLAFNGEVAPGHDWFVGSIEVVGIDEDGTGVRCLVQRSKGEGEDSVLTWESMTFPFPMELLS